MNTTVTLSLDLTIPEAEELLGFVRDHLRPQKAPPSGQVAAVDQQHATTVVNQQDDGTPGVKPVLVFRPGIRAFTLAYLLDKQLRKLVSFAIMQNGTFYNSDLAKELGVDTPL